MPGLPGDSFCPLGMACLIKHILCLLQRHLCLAKLALKAAFMWFRHFRCRFSFESSPQQVSVTSLGHWGRSCWSSSAAWRGKGICSSPPDPSRHLSCRRQPENFLLEAEPRNRGHIDWRATSSHSFSKWLAGVRSAWSKTLGVFC